MLACWQTPCSALQKSRKCSNQHRQPSRVVRCMASKTTSSRSKTTSSRSEGTTSTQQPLAPNLTTKPNSSSYKSLQERVDAVSERIGSYLSFLVPKQEGDFGDMLMICLSMSVLIYMSMQLYRLYAYAYFQAGSYSMMMDMMQ